MSKLLRERLLAQREALDAAMAALRAAGAGAAASAPAGQQEALDASLPDQAPPAIPHALLLALIGMDDAGLRREFDAHADLAADDKGERRMSKAGLASFMHGQGLAHRLVKKLLGRGSSGAHGWLVAAAGAVRHAFHHKSRQKWKAHEPRARTSVILLAVCTARHGGPGTPRMEMEDRKSKIDTFLAVTGMSVTGLWLALGFKF